MLRFTQLNRYNFKNMVHRKSYVRILLSHILEFIIRIWGFYISAHETICNVKKLDDNTCELVTEYIRFIKV